MTHSLQRVLIDALDYLIRLNREGIRAQDARAQLRLLQQQHPSIKIELLWEEEAYDGSLHYDTLFHLAGIGTVSLSFCPEHTLPWPMRGVHRWSEGDLLRVNHAVLTVEHAIANLDFMWEDARILNRLVNVCLIREAIEKEPFELSDVELQLAMDGFRRAHKLYTVDATYRWMEQRGMAHEQFERYVADEAMVAKLRDRMTAGLVDDYFAAHREDFDIAYIARFECADEEYAQLIATQLRMGEVDFYEVAQRCFLAAAEHSAPASYNGFALIQRGQAPTILGTAIFGAYSGDIVGPMRSETGYTIARVLSFRPANLDERTRRAIQNILFEDWLAERRRIATIEWYWGNPARISRAVEEGTL